MFFFQRNWSPLVFVSRFSSFSVIHVNVDIEIKSKERIGCCCCCFYLWKVAKLYDLPPKRAGAWNAKFHPGLHERVDVRTIFSETKFLGCVSHQISYVSHQIFLPKVLRFARESSAKILGTLCNLFCAIACVSTIRLLNRFVIHHLKTRKVLEPKCVPLLSLGSLLGMQRTAKTEL